MRLGYRRVRAIRPIGWRGTYIENSEVHNIPNCHKSIDKNCQSALSDFGRSSACAVGANGYLSGSANVFRTQHNDSPLQVYLEMRGV